MEQEKQQLILPLSPLEKLPHCVPAPRVTLTKMEIVIWETRDLKGCPQNTPLTPYHQRVLNRDHWKCIFSSSLAQSGEKASEVGEHQLD